MSVIWKFELDPWGSWVKMPTGSVPFACGLQDGRVVFWAEVEPDADLIERRIVNVMTGEQVPGNPDRRRYLGTATVDERPAGGELIVTHVYDTGRERSIWE